MVLLSALGIASISFAQPSAATSAPPSSTVVPKQGEAIPAGELNPSSFGISPSTITVSSAARNGTFANDISIINSSNETQVFQVSANGDVADWVRFGPEESPVKQFDISVAPGRTSVRVQTSIPADIANGTYGGAVLLSASPKAGSKSGVSVTFEVGMSIVVDGEQIMKASYSNLTVGASEVGQTAEVRATVANTGNVALPVTATATIERGDVLVEKLATETSQTVLPASSGDIILAWNTADALPGDYTVTVDITAGSLQLGTKQQTVRLEAPGKLTRALAVSNLSVAQEPDVRPLLSGSVRNTGQVGGRATVRAQIMKKGKPQSVVQGDSFFVAPGQDIAFALNLPLLGGGEYVAEVTAEFDNYRSPSATTSFTVKAESTTPPIVPIVAGLGAGALLLFGLMKRRQRSTQNSRTRKPPIRDNTSVVKRLDTSFTHDDATPEVRQYETL